MNTALLFSFGFITPILELHLLSFHLEHTYVSLCFVFQTLSYAVFSIGGVYIFQRFDERIIIFFGINLMAAAYLLLAPWSFIFPQDLWLVLLALPIMGLGEAMIYGNF